jgi:hypothetical protein
MRSPSPQFIVAGSNSSSDDKGAPGGATRGLSSDASSSRGLTLRVSPTLDKSRLLSARLPYQWLLSKDSGENHAVFYRILLSLVRQQSQQNG